MRTELGRRQRNLMLEALDRTPVIGSDKQRTPLSRKQIEAVLGSMRIPGLTPIAAARANHLRPRMLAALVGVPARRGGYFQGIPAGGLVPLLEAVDEATRRPLSLRVFYGASLRVPARAVTPVLALVHAAARIEEATGVRPHIEVMFTASTGAALNRLPQAEIADEKAFLARTLAGYFQHLGVDSSDFVILADEGARPFAETEQLVSGLGEAAKARILALLNGLGGNPSPAQSLRYAAAHVLAMDLGVIPFEPLFGHPAPENAVRIDMGGLLENQFFQARREVVESSGRTPTALLLSMIQAAPYNMARDGDVPLRDFTPERLNREYSSLAESVRRDYAYLGLNTDLALAGIAADAEGELRGGRRPLARNSVPLPAPGIVGRRLYQSTAVALLQDAETRIASHPDEVWYGERHMGVRVEAQDGRPLWMRIRAHRSTVDVDRPWHVRTVMAAVAASGARVPELLHHDPWFEIHAYADGTRPMPTDGDRVPDHVLTRDLPEHIARLAAIKGLPVNPRKPGPRHFGDTVTNLLSRFLPYPEEKYAAALLEDLGITGDFAYPRLFESSLRRLSPVEPVPIDPAIDPAGMLLHDDGHTVFTGARELTLGDPRASLGLALAGWDLTPRQVHRAARATSRMLGVADERDFTRGVVLYRDHGVHRNALELSARWSRTLEDQFRAGKSKREVSRLIARGAPQAHRMFAAALECLGSPVVPSPEKVVWALARAYGDAVRRVEGETREDRVGRVRPGTLRPPSDLAPTGTPDPDLGLLALDRVEREFFAATDDVRTSRAASHARAAQGHRVNPVARNAPLARSCALTL